MEQDLLSVPRRRESVCRSQLRQRRIQLYGVWRQG
ncbi:DNA primase [Gordonia phage ReMo]|nr:DNA primase [Gordonia phage ReMo]